MAVTQYVGSRYVPLFADPAEWSAANAYEALTIVLHEGNSFTSKQPVPVGIDISNEAYWAQTGNYNAQIEAYRRETADAVDRADNALNAANSAQNDINILLPKADFSADNTVKDYIDAQVGGISIFDWFSNTMVNRSIETEFVGTIPMRGFTGTPQGCASNGTYLYQYYQVGTTDSYVQIVNPATAEVIRTEHLPIYCGHGNSFNYDALTNTFVLISSNRRLTILDVDCNILWSGTYSTSYATISQLAITNDMIVVNNTGTNSYSFYSRLDENYALYVGTMQYPSHRYLQNFVQDCFSYNNVFFSVVGSTNYKCMIDSFSMINGCNIGSYVINIPLEPEGICVCGDYVYITLNEGSIYRFPMRLMYGNTTSVITNNYATAFDFEETIGGTIAFGTTDIVSKYSKTVDGFTFYFPYPRFEFANRYMAPMYALVDYNSRIFASRLTNGSLRVKYNSQVCSNCVILANYAVSSSLQRQYLASLACYDAGESYSNVAIARFNENDTDEVISQAISEFKSAVTAHFPSVTNGYINCTVLGSVKHAGALLPDIILNLGEA